ncbi:MAG: Nramp family divalent metal transporter [Sulfolobales archaeon]|nr:Nramp family divalent metal transporter [Sulfolobales archaeon]MCX8186606.1 Nramp family divalent metal transporter [Sulfolobales archaeon]MDW7969901.1 Nramp family divalent metal transporter [Sulfolobales archaeon]
MDVGVKGKSSNSNLSMYIQSFTKFDRSFRDLNNVPEPPKNLLGIIGPGAILTAMAIGAGELILWPVLVTQHGYGLLWIIPIALIVQYFWVVESCRWTVSTGESWIQGTGRIPGRGLWVTLWLLSMTISLIWPGWAVSSASALWVFTGGSKSPLDLVGWGIVSYLLCVIALTIPRYVYSGLYTASLISLAVFNIGLIISGTAVAINNPSSFTNALSGLINFGYVPSGVDMRLLASAIGWAGLGSMGNAFYSLYVRDRGVGMASYVGRIPGVLGKSTTISDSGFTPDLGKADNATKLRKWIKLLEKEVFTFFFIPSLISLFLFTYLAGALLRPALLRGDLRPSDLSGITAVVMQSKFFEVILGPAGYYIYLLVAVFVLWSTQIGILDAMARTWADTTSIYIKRVRDLGIKKTYLMFLAVFTLVGLVVITSGLFRHQPVELVKLGAYLGLIQQILSIPATIVLNHYLMPKELRKAAGVKALFSGALLTGMLLYLISFIGGL